MRTGKASNAGRRGGSDGSGPHLLPQLSANGCVQLEEQALAALVARARLSKVVHPLILRVVVYYKLLD